MDVLQHLGSAELPCMLWPKYKDKAGYGRTKHLGKMVLAHRLAYARDRQLDVFELNGLVLHSCDNPSCVEPSHLRLGTHRENMDDMVLRARQPARTRHGQSKLTDRDVEQIRSQYVPRCPINGGAAIARELGVSQRLISAIVNNVVWKPEVGNA